MPRVLFVNPNFEDYLSDSLFHGLRTLLGPAAVDHPKAEPLYRTHPPERRAQLYGRGFTLYGLLDDLDVDRNRALDRAAQGEFDLVVFSDIWRNFGLFTQWIPELGTTQVAVLDGSDRVEPYPYAGKWWRVRRWWMLPRVRPPVRLFKREITPLTYWFRSYLTLPGGLGRRLGLLRGMQGIAFSIPEQKLVGAPPDKDREFATHVVDPEVAARVGGEVRYAFADEGAYAADLRRSRFAITTRRAGWDCLRHYEIAAAGCVPCFRDLDRKPASCAPYGLHAGNAISYRDVDDLLGRVQHIGDEEYRRLQAGAMAWARANTTRLRAHWFLEQLGLPAPDPAVAAPPVAAEA